MKRLRRWMFNLAAGVSLGICVAAISFSVRGFWFQDLPQICYQWYPQSDRIRMYWFAIRSLRGTFEFGVMRNDRTLNRPNIPADYRKQGFRWVYSATPTEHNQQPKSLLRFGFEHQGSPYPIGATESWTLILPSWFLILLFAVLPSIWLLRKLRARNRVRAGLCTACGYDLRATPDRCPECGTVPAAAKGAAT